MNNKLPVYPPLLTTAERDALPASLRKVEARIYNTTTGQDEKWNGAAWVAVSSGGGSVTPLNYLAPPADNDTARQAFLVALQTDLIAKGLMTAPPSYVISGQVTGSIQNGISVELRDNGTNALLDTVTTNGSGNYTFPARVAGTYKVIPVLAGYVFTPTNAVIALSSNTTQNFTSAVDLGSAEVSPTHVLVMSSNAARAMKKTPRGMETDTFGNVAGNAFYGQLYYNSRYFLPGYTAFRLYSYSESGGVFTIRMQLNTADPSINVGNPYKVFVSSAGKIAIMGGSSIRFGTYNNVTETFTPGNLVNIGVFMNDAVFLNDKIYIVSNWGGTPARNLTIIDMVTETVTTQNVAAFSGSNISNIGAGDGKLLVGTGSQSAVIDAATFAQVGSTVVLGATQLGRTAFSSGRFWLTHGANLRWINASNAATGLATFTSSPAPGALHGVVADANFVYAADNGNGRLYTVDSATAQENGSSVVAMGGTGIAYLKN